VFDWWSIPTFAVVAPKLNCASTLARLVSEVDGTRISIPATGRSA